MRNETTSAYVARRFREIEAATPKPAPKPSLPTVAEVAAQGRRIAALADEIATVASHRAPPAPVVVRSDDPTRHVSDHVGHALDSFSESGRAEHRLAIAYIEKANARGMKPEYAEAVRAVTRKRSAP